MIYFGQNIGLVPIDHCDTNALFRWRNDWQVYKSCRQRDMILHADHNIWYERVTVKNDVDKMYGVIVPEILEDAKPGHTYEKQLVGVCGLTNIDWINRRAEFSLYIGPECQGKGYGKGALKTLLSHGFSTFGFESIWGESFDDNPAIGLFLKLGMGCDGIRRHFYYREGKFINAHLFSILKSEWETGPAFHDARRQQCFI